MFTNIQNKNKQNSLITYLLITQLPQLSTFYHSCFSFLDQIQSQSQ